jgi:hypothetical protein
MIDKETWGFTPEWLDYVNSVWVEGGRVQQIKNGSKESIEFRERAERAFSEKGILFKHVKTWVSIQVPKEGEGYDVGYPHIHYPLTGTTLVHYLEPGDNPAPLHIIVDDEVVEEVIPEAGLTVFMPNNLWHGVLKNNGTRNRVQMIATALK